MNRLILSAIGVILTFVWIIYDAPPQQHKMEDFNSEPIKTINKSGSASLHKIRPPDFKSIDLDSAELKLHLAKINSRKL